MIVKGSKLLNCNECKRRRFCTRISLPGYYFKWTCSKGHSWVIKGITSERINAVMKDIFSKNKLQGLFERDDAFFKELRRR